MESSWMKDVKDKNIKNFLEECCLFSSAASVIANDLYSAFCLWLIDKKDPVYYTRYKFQRIVSSSYETKKKENYIFLGLELNEKFVVRIELNNKNKNKRKFTDKEKYILYQFIQKHSEKLISRQINFYEAANLFQIEHKIKISMDTLRDCFSGLGFKQIKKTKRIKKIEIPCHTKIIIKSVIKLFTELGCEIPKDLRILNDNLAVTTLFDAEK